MFLIGLLASLGMYLVYGEVKGWWVIQDWWEWSPIGAAYLMAIARQFLRSLPKI